MLGTDAGPPTRALSPFFCRLQQQRLLNHSWPAVSTHSCAMPSSPLSLGESPDNSFKLGFGPNALSIFSSSSGAPGMSARRTCSRDFSRNLRLASVGGDGSLSLA